jgi:hypothetical protein
MDRALYQRLFADSVRLRNGLLDWILLLRTRFAARSSRPARFDDNPWLVRRFWDWRSFLAAFVYFLRAKSNGDPSFSFNNKSRPFAAKRRNPPKPKPKPW